MTLTSAVVLLPLAVALMVAAVPRSEPALTRALALLGAVVELGLIVALISRFEPGGAAVQQPFVRPWLPAYGVEWSFGIDGSELAMLLLIGLVVPLALVIGPRPRPGEPPLLVGMLSLQTAWVAVVLARDLVTLAAAWELAAVATVILLGERGDGKMGVPGRTAAARRYAAQVLPGAAALVALVILLGVAHAHATGGVWSWSLDALSQLTLPPGTQYFGFALVMVAVATALPIWPLHAPLISICVTGPTQVVAAVLGVGGPLGLFVLMRVGLPMFPLAAGEWADPIAAVAVVGAIYAALVCWAEREPGRLLGHVALLHLSLAIVAAVSGSAAARVGMGPYLLAHGLALTVLTTVTHSLRRDGVGNLGELAGWASVAPRGLVVAMLAGLLLVGVPGSAGFIGELGIVVGVLREGDLALLRPGTWGLLAAAAVGVGALGLLRSLWQAGRGSARPGLVARLSELDLRELCVCVLALVLAVILGVVPGWLVRRIEPAQRREVEQLVLGRCLAIEASVQKGGHARARMHADLVEELGAVCLDPDARVRQFYGLPGDAAVEQEGAP
ncbi:proton-conducting transporter transmembrane domain-containing protein [Enhygromyxa salina]|uniref:NADH-quinone oxidoreductase subunit M n=1 Tax=Enhygromyxa salina TaxID=215803 RepID=A0A2S9XZN2_9BACT|nr:proton-conducting transporter membrane subunit [Enhygromyxa salina]PRP98327.1 NADH-quinone oxidoreductase subunit M [Enhygromyxa salina]